MLPELGTFAIPFLLEAFSSYVVLGTFCVFTQCATGYIMPIFLSINVNECSASL